MDQIASILILFVFTLFGVILLGIVAGSSPTLYLAEAVQSQKVKKSRGHLYALISGVLLALVILLIIFQLFNLTNLLNTLGSSLDALLISVAFNILIGLLFVFGGLRYVSSRNLKPAYETDARQIRKVGNLSAFFGFGFAKTFLSISGATAVFIAGNMIAGTTSTFAERTILTAAFLAATLVPFLVVLNMAQKNPDQLVSIVNKAKSGLDQVNYRMTVGVIAIIFGGAIVIFNIMMALFY